MTDPVRWRDDPQAPTAVRQLLAAAPPVTPLADNVRDLTALRLRAPVREGASNVFQRLLEGRARGVSTGAGRTVAGGTVIKAGLVLVVAGVGASFVGKFFMASSGRASRPAPSEQRGADPRSERHSEPLEVLPAEMPAVQAPVPRDLPALSPADAPLRVARTSAAPRRSTVRPPSAQPVSRQPATSASDPLLAEAHSLKAIRQLDDPDQRLRALERHAQQFPSGALLSESRVLEIQARLALGQRAEAERIARELRAQDPAGFEAYRVERLLSVSLKARR